MQRTAIDNAAPARPPEPRLAPTVIASLLILMAFVALAARATNGFEAWTYEALRRHAAADGALRAPPLTLRDASDRRLDVFRDAPPGTVYLVDFIYTRCPTVCQALGSEYTRMQRALRESSGPGAPRVRLLSLSIDPANDDAAALRAYGKLHRADAAYWTLAAPADTQAGRAALRQLGVVAIPDGLGGYVHNGSIHLVDGSGRVHRIFDYDAWPQALEAAMRLGASATP